MRKKLNVNRRKPHERKIISLTQFQVLKPKTSLNQIYPPPSLPIPLSIDTIYGSFHPSPVPHPTTPHAMTFLPHTIVIPRPTIPSFPTLKSNLWPSTPEYLPLPCSQPMWRGSRCMTSLSTLLWRGSVRSPERLCCD